MITAHPFFFDGGWGGGFFAIVVGLFSVAFWVVVIMIAVRVLSTMRRDASPRSDALSILEQRYARGEIDRDEFLERRRVLSGES